MSSNAPRGVCNRFFGLLALGRIVNILHGTDLFDFFVPNPYPRIPAPVAVQALKSFYPATWLIVPA
jgi:hypothetical protein